MKIRKTLVLACALSSLLVACRSNQGNKTLPATVLPEKTLFVAQTVISSLGKLEPFDNLGSAESRLGWRIMRPRDARFHLIQQGGLLRTDGVIGLARLEQAYGMDGRKGAIEIFQEPEAYPLGTSDNLTPLTIGRFAGELHKTLPHGTFFFFSGERVGDQRVRIAVYTHQSSDLTENDFLAFVVSLDVGFAARSSVDQTTASFVD